MKTYKKILILISLIVATTGLALSQQEEAKGVNKAAGKIKILYNEKSYALVEFKVYEGRDTKPPGGYLKFKLSDRNESVVKLLYVKIDGEYAWFAGKCIKDTGNRKDQWLFLAAHDGGIPGRLVDHIWWDWLPDTPDARKIARKKIEDLEKPENNKPIKAGNVIVYSKD
jgi:hypothetical protein